MDGSNGIKRVKWKATIEDEEVLCQKGIQESNSSRNKRNKYCGGGTCVNGRIKCPDHVYVIKATDIFVHDIHFPSDTRPASSSRAPHSRSVINYYLWISQPVQRDRASWRKVNYKNDFRQIRTHPGNRTQHYFKSIIYYLWISQRSVTATLSCRISLLLCRPPECQGTRTCFQIIFNPENAASTSPLAEMICLEATFNFSPMPKKSS